MRQSGALEHFADARFGGPGDFRMRRRKFDAQLARSPTPAIARRQDLRDHFIAEPSGRMLRLAASVGKRSDTASIIPVEPLVNGLARDLVNLGERGDAAAFLAILNEPNPQVHGVALFPRHRLPASSPSSMPSESSKIVNLDKVSPMSSDKSVTHVPGLDPDSPARQGGGSLGSCQQSNEILNHWHSEN
jgi:hypothetical protein